MTPSSCKRQLAEAGLHVSFERSAVIGWEWVVEDRSGKSVASGYHEGTRSDAAADVMADARVKRAIVAARETVVQP